MERTFDILETKDKTRVWKLTLQGDSLVFEPPEGDGGEPRVITRVDLPTRIDIDPLIAFGIVRLIAEPHKLMLQLTTEAREAVIEWMGPPTKADLRAALQRRYNATSLLVGAFLVLASGPWFFPETRDGLDWLFVVWGASAFPLWVLARVTPHRVWLLADVLIQTAIAGWFVHGIITGTRHIAWSFLILLALLGFTFAMKQYRRFAKMAPE